MLAVWETNRHTCSSQYFAHVRACLAHQSLTSTAPTYLSADIQLVSEHGRRHLRSSSYTEHSLFHAHVPLSATEVLLSHAAPRVWNSLPATLRQIRQFRQPMRTQLFRAQKSRRIVTFWLFCATQMLLFTFLLTCEAEKWYFSVYLSTEFIHDTETRLNDDSADSIWWRNVVDKLVQVCRKIDTISAVDRLEVPSVSVAVPLAT